MEMGLFVQCRTVAGVDLISKFYCEKCVGFCLKLLLI